MNFSHRPTVSQCAPRVRKLRLEPLEDRRMLAVFTVDNLNDSGLGSLRQAIDDANAAAGADTIEFQPGIAGTISLSTGQMTIADELTIDGLGHEELTIDAEQNSRIFHITPESGPVTVEGLRLTGGEVLVKGGAILSETDANLSIERSLISGNSAIGDRTSRGGAIFALGDLTVAGSTILENSAGAFGGGGAHVYGDVTITDSTISNNSATGGGAKGGGVFAWGKVTISNSTVSGNSLAVSARASGGGIYARGDVTVTRSTISGNAVNATSISDSLGGGIFAGGNATVDGSVVSDNSVAGGYIVRGGGIFANRNVAVSGTTIARNSVTAAYDGRAFGAFGGGISAHGDVTITGSTIFGNSVNGDQNANGGGIDVVLLIPSLGPSGQIFFVGSGDVAITDSTVSGNSATGGTVRGGGINSHRDVTTTDTTIAGNMAIGEGNASGGGIAASGQLTLWQSAISGNSAEGQHSVYGGGVSGGSDVSVFDSEIAGNSASGDYEGFGGGVHAAGHAEFWRSTISGNSVESNSGSAGGGGVFADFDVNVSESLFLGNSAASESSVGQGGAIAASGGATVSLSTISANTASAGLFGAVGGGIGVWGEVNVTRSTISGNLAVGANPGVLAFGGGIYSYGHAAIASSTISGNSAIDGLFGAGGGGIAAYRSASVTNSTISGNKAIGIGFGGGISVPILTVQNSIVAGNQTDTGNAPDLVGPQSFVAGVRNSLIGNKTGTGLAPAPVRIITVRHSLIGDNSDTGLAPAPVGMPDADGNLIGTGLAPIDPLLGPLQDNGGPTFTHALLADSPAIDAGDNASAPAFDQRGYVRVVDGGSGQKIIDMGAVEFGATLAGDGNGDGRVGEEDYTIWANNFGLSAEGIPGDYNNDGVVGPQDYTVWANNFGAGTPPGESAMSLRPVESALQNLRDSDHSTIGFRHSSFDEVVAGLLTEPLTPGSTGSASAGGAAIAANIELNHRPVEPAVQISYAAHDAAIAELTSQGMTVGQLSYLEGFWALLNANLNSPDNDSHTIPP